MGYSPVLQSSCLKRERIQLCKCYTNVKGNTISEKLHHSDIYFLSTTGKTPTISVRRPQLYNIAATYAPCTKENYGLLLSFFNCSFFLRCTQQQIFVGTLVARKWNRRKPQLPSFKRHTQNLTLPYSHTNNYELCNFF